MLTSLLPIVLCAALGIADAASPSFLPIVLCAAPGTADAASPSFLPIVLCAAPGTADAASPSDPPNAQTRSQRYAAIRTKLDADREALRVIYAASKLRDRKLHLAAARARVHTAIRDELMPPWFGTPWDFYGTSQTPGEGKIACGYFVTTLLRDAAFKVERVKLAQQASEKIVQTLSAPNDIRRYRRGNVTAVVNDTKSRGDGLYVIGMDFHVAFLDVKGEHVRLCHSAVLAPGTVVCEPAQTAEGMISAYHVVGPLLSDARMVDWLFARALPTKTD